MASLLEHVGSVHIFLGPYRGNPIALYLRRTESGCQIGPKVYPWNDVMGVGETPNKAAADFEEKWKTKGLTANMYSGPAWEGGIKPERPAPPKPAPPSKPAVAPVGTAPGSPVASAPITNTVRTATVPVEENVSRSPAARAAPSFLLPVGLIFSPIMTNGRSPPMLTSLPVPLRIVFMGPF